MKSKRAHRVIYMCLLLILLLILGCAVGACAYLYGKYRDTYTPIDIVTAPDTFVMPDYPVLDSGPASDSEATHPDTVPPLTVPETADPGTNPPETSPQTTPPVTTPPITEPPVTSLPETLPIQGGVQGEVSIYGGVPIYKVAQRDPDVVNILLLGSDSRDLTYDRGRSDTMMVISYNEKTGQVKLLSLLRDSLVPVDGHDWNRLNTAYVFGGVGLAVNTINRLFGLDIQQFVIIDIEGAKEAVGMIGGLDLNLTQAEADYYNKNYKTSYVAGMNHLEAEMVLNHLRNRSLDSDFGRTRRQRDVVIATVKKVMTEKSLPEVLELVDHATAIVKTNIPLSTLTTLATSVFLNRDRLSVETQSVPFDGAYRLAWYKGMSILSFDIENAKERIEEYLWD